MSETKRCPRCVGTGLYPSSRWNGTCLMCRGRKIVKARRPVSLRAPASSEASEPTAADREESANWMLTWMNQ